MNKLKVINSTIAAALALNVATIPLTATAASDDMEKCAGVAKAGNNDCATDKHACAGQAKTDADASEWVFVPKGSCEKLVNGKVIPDKSTNSAD